MVNGLNLVPKPPTKIKAFIINELNQWFYKSNTLLRITQRKRGECKIKMGSHVQRLIDELR